MSGRYPSDWGSRRREVYQRDGYRCGNCRARGGRRGDTELHAHHIVPIAQGGSHRRSNLVTLCEACHGAAHGHRMAPTASEPSPATAADLAETARKAKRTYRTAKKVVRWFS